MHKTNITVLLILFAFCASHGSASVWTFLSAQPQFSSLVDFLTQQSADSLLDDAGSTMTLFAPNNAAFEKLGLSKANLDALGATLAGYLVVEGRVYSDSFKNDLILVAYGRSLPKDSQFLRINTYGQVTTINGVPIVAFDANQTNGVVHEISEVLYPFTEINKTITQTFPNALFTLAITNPIVQIPDVFTSLGTDLTNIPSVSALLDNRVFDTDSQYTFFAPQDNAWSAITASNHTAILLNHIVKGSIFSAGLKTGPNEVTTLLGTKLIITLQANGSLSVGLTGSEASSVYKDRMTRSGVIHVIDNVLLPQKFLPLNILQYLASAGNFKTLLSVISELNLNETVTNTNSFVTLFAPTDTAFTNAGINTSNPLLSQIGHYHLLNDQLVSAFITNDLVAQTLASSNGDQWVRFNLYPSGIYLDGTAKIVTHDVVTSSGIIHIVDHVLLGLAASANETVAQALNATGFSSLYAAVLATSHTDVLSNTNFDATKQITFLSSQDSDWTAPSLVVTSIYQNLTMLATILDYLIIPSSYYPTYFADGVQAELLTRAGENVTISRVGNNFTVNGVQTDGPFNRRNGLQYIVRSVLFPPSLLTGEMVDVLSAGNHSSLLFLLGTFYPSDLFLLACRINTQQITWFAPTDAAFLALGLTPANMTALASNGTLRAVLANMILVGAHPQTSWSNTVELLSPTYAGNSFLRVNEYQGNSYVNGFAKIEKSQVLSSGSVLHSISAVFMPVSAAENTSLLERLNNEPTVSTFTSKVQSQIGSILGDTSLNASNQYTVFAPTNAAFAALSANVTAALAADSSQYLAVLKYHVVVGTKYSVAFGSSLTMNTLQGANLAASGMMVGNATITTANLNTRGGVVHIINKVLIPDSVAAYIAAYAQSTGTYVVPAPAPSASTSSASTSASTTSATTGGSTDGGAPAPITVSEGAILRSVWGVLFMVLLALIQ